MYLAQWKAGGLNMELNSRNNSICMNGDDYNRLKNAQEENDSMINEMIMLKAKVNRLEREKNEIHQKLTAQSEVNTAHIAHIKKLNQENKTLCKPDVVFELQKDLQERCDRAIDLKEENTQLKESRGWDYEYIVKVNEENKRLKREKEEFQRKLTAQLEVNTELRMSNKDKHAILSEFSEHIGNKPSSSTYKYFRGKLNALEIKEGE